MNAVEQNKQYHETFYIPHSKDLDELKVGDHVKVCASSERFWAQIQSLGEKITARIDNDLICTDEHGFIDGDVIEFGRENILSILPA